MFYTPIQAQSHLDQRDLPSLEVPLVALALLGQGSLQLEPCSQASKYGKSLSLGINNIIIIYILEPIELLRFDHYSSALVSMSISLQTFGI